ncbi:hypothetical protein B4135_3225 [Caldibacillus debilis]|uniref:Uncharacterized protein n=1 Tax=Caldibacillus debilis TaxID=301148 RepID=A0A150LFV1_9BACI|nr:hypothetical protein B4135_3225 [Caldibacillus debilis]
MTKDLYSKAVFCPAEDLSMGHPPEQNPPAGRRGAVQASN